MPITTIHRVLVDAAIDETRVRIEMNGWTSPVLGYVSIPFVDHADLIDGALCGDYPTPIIIRVAYNRGCTPMSFFVRSIRRLETAAKDRKLDRRRVLWEPNPLVMTPSGAIDMANSLRELLGVA